MVLRRLPHAAVLLLLLAGCGGSSSKVQPVRKAPGYIAYAVNQDDFNEIWRMQPDGGSRRRLTRALPLHPVGNGSTNPARSPDGAFIAYAWNHDIYRMRADGSGKRRLTSDRARDLQPAWSPDGKRIAFAHEVDLGAFAIDTMTADGRDRHELARVVPENGAVFLLMPAWSPDGTQITYTRYALTAQTDISIYVMSSDGTGRTRLIDHATQPAWSPDGTQIAFVSDRDHNGPCKARLLNCPGYAAELYVARADGRSVRRLTTTRADERRPTWSPDGSRIAFARAADDRRGYAIYTVRPDGTSLRRLTGPAHWAYQPSWGSG